LPGGRIAEGEFEQRAHFPGRGGRFAARNSILTEPPHGRQVARELANLSTERTLKLEWALAGLLIWLISLDTCLGCETAPEPIFVGYSLHESAMGTTERPER
jgi:hypothetical protein